MRINQRLAAERRTDANRIRQQAVSFERAEIHPMQDLPGDGEIDELLDQTFSQTRLENPGLIHIGI